MPLQNHSHRICIIVQFKALCTDFYHADDAALDMIADTHIKLQLISNQRILSIRNDYLFIIDTERNSIEMLRGRDTG